MNKTELIEAIAQATELPKTVAGRAWDAVVDTITKSLQKRESVEITGFGKFLVRERAARSGRNPQTGDTIQIKASHQPVFKAGKALKDAVQ